MDKAAAKREACWLVAGFIEDNMISTGWPHTPAHEDDYNEADFERIDAALWEIVAELKRRGYKT